MKRWPFLLGLLALTCLWAPVAQAGPTCSTFTTPGVSINYMANTTASVQTMFSVTCTREAGDPTSISYTVRADNGSNPTGQNNQAAHSSGALLRYDVYTDAACGTQWKGTRTIGDTITWGATSYGPITRSTSYWGCIVTAQSPTAAGAYTDGVGLTLTYNPGTGATTMSTTAPVTIYAPANCTVAPPSTALSLNYMAFGAAQSASRNFGVTCTTGMPYTMAVDTPSGTLLGLTYTLALSATSSNGTGTQQTHTVSAAMPGGQAGSCAGAACSASATHTITVTY